MRPARAIALCFWIATPAAALDLPLPTSAVLAAEDAEALDSLIVPVGPWRNGRIEVEAVEGAVARQAWRFPQTALTTLQIITPLRDALAQAGYEILYECRDEECGGFDFRYQLDLLPEPVMHVDLGDYRYLAARADGDEDQTIVLVASRSARQGFLHVSRVGPPDPAGGTGTGVIATEAPPSDPPDSAAPGSALVRDLEATGHAVLSDLRFATGSAELEDTLFPSLVALAEWLNANPEEEVVLVGHSDAVGTLEANIALSKARAGSVATRLVAAHGVAPAQISAEGAGFLAPRASNETEEGRTQNRRVEAVRRVRR